MCRVIAEARGWAIVVLALMVLWVGSQPADANLVANGDFSANATSFTAFPGYASPWSAGNPATVPGWTFSSTGGSVWGVNGTLGGMANVFGPGDKSAASTWGFVQNPGGSLSQVLSLQPNTTYQFSYLAAARNGEATASGQVTISDNTNTYYDSGSTAWGSAAFQLVSTQFSTGGSLDGPVVISLNNTAAPSQTVNFSNLSITEPVFVPTVVNPSFEADNVADGTYITANPAGWSSTGGSRGVIDRNVSGGYNTGVAPTPDADGEQFAWSNGSHLYQVLDASLFPNTTYTLTVDVTSRSDLPFPAGTELRLGTGGTFGQNLLTPVDPTLPTVTPGEWTEWQLVYETGDAPADLGQLLRIELLAGGVQPLFDNLRLTAVAIPEPTTLSAVGLLAFAGLVRRPVGTRRR